MVKPFRHPSELIARIRTRLRRTNADVLGLLTIGDLAIDVQAHQILRAGKQIALTRLEFDLLVALAKEPGRVFTRDALLSEVWGYRHSTDTRLVNVHVQRLRSKIEHDAEHPEIVITVRGVGYKAGAMGGS
jgi:two-component system response regulator MtrA